MPITEKLIRLRDPNNSSNIFYPFTVGQAVVCQDGNGDPRTLQSYIDEIESYQGGGGSGGTPVSVPTERYPSGTLTVTSTSTPFISVGGVTYSIKVDSSGESVTAHRLLDPDVHTDTASGTQPSGIGRIIASDTSGKWSSQSFVEYAEHYGAVPLVGHFDPDGLDTWFNTVMAYIFQENKWFDDPEQVITAEQNAGRTLQPFTCDLTVAEIKEAMETGRQVYILGDVEGLMNTLNLKLVFEPLAGLQTVDGETVTNDAIMLVSNCAYSMIGTVQIFYYTDQGIDSCGLIVTPRLTQSMINNISVIDNLPFNDDGYLEGNEQVSTGDVLVYGKRDIYDSSSYNYSLKRDNTIAFDTTVNNKYLCQNGTWQTVSGGSGTTVTLPQDYSESTGITLSSSALTTVCTIGNTQLKLKVPAGGSGGSDGNYYPSAVSWTAGTTNGPTGLITMLGGGTNVNIPAIPAANGTKASGIVTTKAQIFGGVKTFSSTPKLTTNSITTSDGYTQTFPNATGTVVNGTGTSNYIAKWNGTNSVTNGPAFGSSTTTFLRNDGTWATPAGGGSTSLEFNYAIATHTQASGTGTQGYSVYDVTTDPSKKNFVEVTLLDSHFTQDESPMIRFNYDSSTETFNSANLPSEIYLLVHNEVGYEVPINNEMLFASGQTGYWAQDPPPHISSNTPIGFWTKLPTGSSNLYSMTVIRNSSNVIVLCMFNWLGSFDEQ